jgi:hypothetical protein
MWLLKAETLLIDPFFFTLNIFKEKKIIFFALPEFVLNVFLAFRFPHKMLYQVLFLKKESDQHLMF